MLQQPLPAYGNPPTVPEAEAGRWKQTLWVGASPPLPRVIARQADRAGSDNESILCHGAVGDEEYGGGSKRFLFWVLRRIDQDFQQEVGHVRRARIRSPKEVVQTAVGQPRRSAHKINSFMTIRRTVKRLSLGLLIVMIMHAFLTFTVPLPMWPPSARKAFKYYTGTFLPDSARILYSRQGPYDQFGDTTTRLVVTVPADSIPSLAESIVQYWNDTTVWPHIDGSAKNARWGTLTYKQPFARYEAPPGSLELAQHVSGGISRTILIDTNANRMYIDWSTY